jgi:hypothetical protein
MDSLKNRRHYFSKELQQRQRGHELKAKRATISRTLELETQIPNLDITAILDEAMDLSVPLNELVERMRRLRQLTSCDGFYLTSGSATKRLMDFFAELLKCDDTELLEEVSWCLINLFAEKAFAEIDSTTVVVELNRLIFPSQRISVLENIFSIIYNISVDESGAMVLLDTLDFHNVEQVVQVHMPLLSLYFNSMAEILNNYPDPPLENVSLPDSVDCVDSRPASGGFLAEAIHDPRDRKHIELRD